MENRTLSVKTESNNKKLVIPDLANEPCEEEFNNSLINQFHTIMPVELQRNVLARLPIPNGYKKITSGFYASEKKIHEFRSRKIVQPFIFDLERVEALQQTAEEKNIFTINGYSFKMAPSRDEISFKTEQKDTYDHILKEDSNKRVEMLALVAPLKLLFFACVRSRYTLCSFSYDL